MKGLSKVRRPTFLGRMSGAYEMAQYVCSKRPPGFSEVAYGLKVTETRGAVSVAKSGKIVFSGERVSDYSEGTDVTRLNPDGSGGYYVSHESTGGSSNERLVIYDYRPGFWVIQLFFLQIAVARARRRYNKKKNIENLEKEINDLRGQK